MSKQTGKNDDKEKQVQAGSLAGVDELDEFEPPTPPDGGWGWAVMIASFFSNMIVDGVCYTFGIFFPELVDTFGASKSVTALVGALVPGTYLLVGPIVSSLANKFGCRIVTIVGSLIASVFFVISSFSTSVTMMMITYGILGGVGFGLMYLPSIVMVGYYFDKKRALATGVAVCGSGIGTFVFAPLGQALVDEYGWRGANIVIGGIILNGIVFGLIYRPLEVKIDEVEFKPKRKPVHGQSTIMNKILEEKMERKRRFTIDNTVITEDNKEVPSHETTTPAQAPKLIITTTTGSGLCLEKKENLGGGIYQSSTSLNSQKPAGGMQLLDVGGRRSRTNSMSVTASQRSLAAKKKAVASPFARQDVLYTGSIMNLKEYKAAGDMNTYVSSVMNIKTEMGADGIGSVINVGNEDESFCSPIVAIAKQMFDFSLIKSFTFILITGAGVLGFGGLYTPFVYVQEKAVLQLGVEPAQASLILSVLGACNTVSRVITGFIADNPRVDCLMMHNVAAMIAGAMTALVSVFNSYALLMLYACLFGVSIAAFIALRSIVIVELLGLQKLTNAFGLTSLFQGIIVLVGSPLSGAIQEATGSYVAPFIVSGSLIALGGVICLPARRVANWENEKEKKKAAKYSRIAPKH